jgi:oligopeptide transport system permease protein
MSGPRVSAWRAFRRDRRGVTSLAVLCAITLACVFGPMVSPHPYDRVYPDYVLTPASLAAHPTKVELDRAMAVLAARMRAEVHVEDQPNGEIYVIITAAEPLDLRVLRYLDHSDLLEPLGAVSVQDEGHRLIASARITPAHFLFGTDANGRDLLTRTLVAGRLSLAVGALASAIALGIGVAYGAIAGYRGGRVDAVMMRFVDIVYALPFIFFVIVLVVLFGRALVLIFVAIGAVEWLDMARITRGQTLSLKRRDFVLAARALGASDRVILARHIVPNMGGPIIAYLGLLVPRVILAESFLSFLGLGVQEPLTSWGVLIADGARDIQGALHLLVFPALMLAITLIATARLGDATRRAFDASRA